ncbi:SDR family NAD(P)-dependent oxidoreductase [Actinoplanes auranticolor]|uniref:Short subunit dehydrogenase n=1 Tax=Actinoplanes auranticolor TaxID=47988 RepID=A0A919S703_9ACTN|nr:SDR family NAD(P)-dependent oxidoreductase [Actinoplanes auranticolor]GIM65942.1 hypothetical protein Aau02nite_20820 [Actinoplanes auranticolor]
MGPGLGLAVARRFGREGYPIALLSRRTDRHDIYLASLRNDGITAIAVAADITQPDQLHAAVTTTIDELGPIGATYFGPGAALRTYALTVNAALADTGVYAGALVIGGLVERGDIHRHAVAAVGPAAAASLPTLDPDTIAGTAWDLSARQNRPEATFNALG